MAKATFDHIYAALEAGDYSLAQQLCQKPEVNKYSLAHALLAYTYASQRHYDKALDLARAVNKIPSADESVVNALGCTFKLCKADQDFATCYENAMKTPGCMSAASNLLELFGCYARLEQPKKMQQIAQKLYKLEDKPKYLFWSVGCMLLQVDLPPAMLGVAEKMLHKVFFETHADKAPGAEELQLYLVVLIKQRKLEDALSSLRTLRARSCNANQRKLQDESDYRNNVNMVALQPFQMDLMEIDLLRVVGRAVEVVAACKKFLEAYPEQWNVHSILMDHALGLSPHNAPELVKEHVQTEAVSDLLPFRDNFSLWIPPAYKSAQDVPAHISYLQDLRRRHPKLRGPFLALLWCCTKQVLMTADAAQAQELGHYIAEYVEAFNSKPCCFQDVQPILSAATKLSSDLNVGMLHAVRSRCEDVSAELLGLLMSRISVETTAVGAAISTPSVPPAGAEGQVDDEPSDDEGEGDKGTEVAEAKKGKKKKRKSKAKGKKKDSLVKEDPEPQMKPIDAPALQALAGKDNDLAVLLTRYSQTDFVVARTGMLLNVPIDAEAFVADRLQLFQRATGVFVDGVGGEKRAQHPGDDLAVLLSDSLRTSFAEAFQSSKHAVENLALHWSELISGAIHASNYNYHFKIDALEVCAALNNAIGAHETFQNLGVKNIQFDSMSYLLLPTLLSSAFFSEARTLTQRVHNTQRSNRRESLDMLGRAFDFGNFHQALDLNAFVGQSSRSLAWSLARAEGLLLEFVDRNFRASSVMQYCSAELTKDIATFVAPEAAAALLNHSDYQLILRPSRTPNALHATIRDQQMLWRMLVAQGVGLLVQYFTTQQWEKAAEMCAYLQSLPALKGRAASGGYVPFQQHGLLRDESLTNAMLSFWSTGGRAIVTAQAHLHCAQEGLPSPPTDAPDQAVLNAAVGLEHLHSLITELSAGSGADQLSAIASALLYTVGPFSMLLQVLLSNAAVAGPLNQHANGASVPAAVQTLYAATRFNLEAFHSSSTVPHGLLEVAALVRNASDGLVSVELSKQAEVTSLIVTFAFTSAWAVLSALLHRLVGAGANISEVSTRFAPSYEPLLLDDKGERKNFTHVVEEIVKTRKATSDRLHAMVKDMDFQLMSFTERRKQ